MMTQKEKEKIAALARNDLYVFFDEAQPSRESLLTLKNRVINGQITKHTYWDDSAGSGCLKGTLYMIERGRPVTDEIDRAGLEIDTGDEDWDETLKTHTLMEEQFNGAQINPHSFFEAWFDQFYEAEDLHAQKSLAAWIDEYIEG